MTTGTIFNIQRYSIHDGPGIRTTVFLKGCPLNCWWCHNPESQQPYQQIILWQDRCIGCGDCIEFCPNGAAVIGEEGLVVDKARCSICGKCAKVCPTGAREMVGKKVTAAEVMKEVEKDILFYDQSGGGVTFSGGEPLMQPQFLYDLLRSCQHRGIHTAVDTSGYAPGEVLRRIMHDTDLFLYDIKHMDDQIHRRYCGVSNRIILENLKILVQGCKNVIIRIPVIPGINDGDENIIKTGEFISSLNLRDVSLLPYHNMGIDKYRRIGRENNVFQAHPPTGERLNEIKEKLEGFGLNVKIGG